jgi:hypothetical protein
MKLTPEFEPEFPSSWRRGPWRIRSIGQLMIVIALSGLVLAALPLKSRRPATPPFRVTRVPWKPALIQRPVPGLPERQAPPRDRSPTPRGSFPSLPVPGLQEKKSSPRDPFVIVASAEIDPGMVVRADPDLDAEMVFNPETGRRGSSGSAPAPGGGLGEPREIPEPAPIQPPRVWELRPPVAPQAQPR